MKMATKLYHRPNQSSINDSSLNSNKSDNKNVSAFENLNSNNLSIFYKKDESQFKKKIDKLNFKFYLETDKFISLKSDIEKTQDHLHLLLFKQISEYIDEIERLNLKLKDKNDKEKNPKQIIFNNGKKYEDSEKENTQFKKSILNLENQLKDSKENELKLKKENDSIKRQISHYKDQLNFEISERKKIKEKNCDFEIIETSDNLDNLDNNLENISKNENNLITYNTQPKDYNNSADANKLENTYDLIDTLNNEQNSKVKANPPKAKIKKPDAPTNFNENNKKNHTGNLNLIGKVKRSISYVSQAKSKEQSAILQRIERKNKNTSDELTTITKTQISLYDTKINQYKIPKSKDNKKEKLQSISKVVGKENNSSDKNKPAESNFNISQFKNEFSSIPKKSLDIIDKKFTFKEFTEVAQILVGNMKDEIKILKQEEEMLIQMRREACEESDYVFREESYKSCLFDAGDNFLSNEISKVKTDDTQNYNSVNSNSVNKNKQKIYTNHLMNGIDNKIKNRKKGMKYISSK